MKLRLRQFLTRSGFFKNKSEIDEAINKGDITLSGNEVITSPSYQFNPKKRNVYYKGKLIKPFKKDVYILLNKPAGYLSNLKLSNEEKNLKKRSVFDLLTGVDPKTKQTLFCAGRLDEDSTGLLLITNDGDLANQITNPENKVRKTYQAILEKPLMPKDVSRIESGVTITLEEEGKLIQYKTLPCKIIIDSGNSKRVKIVLSEGKKREAKRIFEAVNNKVFTLERLKIGGLDINELRLKLGEYKIVDKDFILERVLKD